MKSPRIIVIFHPAAIGDSMLATPVASVLRKNFPDTKITYWTHASLEKLLLDYCPSVDAFEIYDKNAGLLKNVQTLRLLNPDLFIDLSNSLRGRVLGLVGCWQTLSYKKAKSKIRPTLHAVDNFVETIKECCVDEPDNYFPTIFPPQLNRMELEKFGLISEPDQAEKQYIAVIPGVGSLRPHRGWFQKRWLQVLDHYQEQKHIQCILIGGPEEKELGEILKRDTKTRVINLCGKIGLPETAQVLKLCTLAISGDTGPAHIARAVGTPVIGLYGPTQIERSGPYGNEHLAISATEYCQCLQSKNCILIKEDGPGTCMEKIEVEAVIDKIETVLKKIPN